MVIINHSIDYLSIVRDERLPLKALSRPDERRLLRLTSESVPRLTLAHGADWETRMRLLAALLAVAARVTAQEHDGCPMHQAGDHNAQVDQRNETTTGIRSEGIRHHFLIAPHGGSIRLDATDMRLRAIAFGLTFARSLAPSRLETPRCRCRSTIRSRQA